MKYMTGNIMDLIGRPDAICITTNGFTTNRGQGVMGMGIAKTMSDAYPELKSALGTHIKAHGNSVGLLMQVRNTRILSFPVKPCQFPLKFPMQVVSHARDKYALGRMVPGFHSIARKDIISRSCDELVKFVNKHGYQHVVLPIPGCGAGELSYIGDDIKGICEETLDDRFWMCSFKESDFRR